MFMLKYPNIILLKSCPMPFVLKEFPIPTPTKAYQFLMQSLHLNMAQSQRYINKGRVIYEGKTLENNEKAKILKNRVCIVVFEPDSMGLKPIYENQDFALFNKPAKMLIHPKGRFAHHSLIDEVRALYGEEASLIHRIDKETSGLVLVGKQKESIAKLGTMFINNEITKEYLALVKGDFRKSVYKARDFCLTLPLATQPKGGDLCVRSKYLGEPNTESLCFKEAKSEFEMLGLWEFNSLIDTSKDFKRDAKDSMESLGTMRDFKPTSCTLLKVRPKTGRTHQIRLHLYALHFPILGDPLYGAKEEHSREYLDKEFIATPLESRSTRGDGLSNAKRKAYFGATRLMLHAYRLRFRFKGKSYDFQSSENFEIP